MALQFNNEEILGLQYNTQEVSELQYEGKAVWVKNGFIPMENSPEWDLLDSSETGVSPTILYGNKDIRITEVIPSEQDIYYMFGNNIVGNTTPATGAFTTTIDSPTIKNESYLLARGIDLDNFVGVTLYNNNLDVWENIAGVWNRLHRMSPPAIGSRVELVWHDDSNIELFVNGTSVVALTTGITSGNFGMLLRGIPDVTPLFAENMLWSS